MSLPINVIDKLFFRFSNIYGSQWMHMWKDNDLSEVKVLWADQLYYYAEHLDAFRWALDNLPERPPNLIEFKKLLSSAPRIDQAEALSWVSGVPMPEFVAVEMKKLSVKPAGGDSKAWAKRILKRLSDGERPAAVAVTFAKQALGVH